MEEDKDRGGSSFEMPTSTYWIIEARQGDEPWADQSIPIPTEAEMLRLLDMFRRTRRWCTYRAVRVDRTVLPS